MKTDSAISMIAKRKHERCSQTNEERNEHIQKRYLFSLIISLDVECVVGLWNLKTFFIFILYFVHTLAPSL